MKVGRKIFFLVRYLGLSWLVFRIWYELARRLGWLKRRMPVGTWDDYRVERVVDESGKTVLKDYLGYRRRIQSLFFLRTDQRAEFQRHFEAFDLGDASCVSRARGVQEGTFVFFSIDVLVVGFPPNWHQHVGSGEFTPGEAHWSEVGDFDHGDIKVIWELNRFGFVYDLVRAYWRMGDESFAETFWALLEDWRSKNPPNAGVNWKCGQEVAFRMMAWIFGMHGFLDARCTTDARLRQLLELVACSAARIEANIGYALSQKNNHAVSESAGLWACGVVFPELHGAKGWRDEGKRLFKRCVLDLIYDDGSFTQHSVNYHRVLLHLCLWVCALGESAGDPLDEEVKQRIMSAIDWLDRLVVGNDGEVPNYGANDGALVFALTNCRYDDFRPVVQAASLVLTGEPRFPDGPWNEETLWFGGVERLPKGRGSLSRCVPELQADLGGYYVLRADHGAVFVRCPQEFYHRPGQADLLHVDLWWRGRNIATDAGTFSYNSEGPWDNGLVHTRVHNTVCVEGNDQMEKAGRFMFLPWPKGNLRYRALDRYLGLDYWEGEHFGYSWLERGIIHRRGIARLGQESWVVIDYLSQVHGKGWEVNWLAPDLPHKLKWVGGRLAGVVLELPEGRYAVDWFSLENLPDADCVRADLASTRGWRSRYYNHREPALSFRVQADRGSALVATVFRPCDVIVEHHALGLRLAGNGWEGSVIFGATVQDPELLVSTVQYSEAGKSQELTLVR